MGKEGIILDIFKICPKRFWPYVIVLILVLTVVFMSGNSCISERIRDPEWTSVHNVEAETVDFQTNTKLKHGKITVRFQYEFKYKGKIFYILEIQGVYNKNQAQLDKSEPDDLNDNEEEQISRFCLKLEEQQKEKLDAFENQFRDHLEKYLKQHIKNFSVEDFEMYGVQIAEIFYQTFKMNNSLPMHVFFSDEEIRTIRKEEARIRAGDTFVDLDRLNLNESFYTNEEINAIIEDIEDKL